MKKQAGFTFTELMLVMIGITILFGAVVSTFLAASKAMQKQQERIPVGEELAQGLQKAARELREAADDSLDQYNKIHNTLEYQDVEDGQFYVLYLYSDDDPNLNKNYVPTALYQLRLAPRAGFTYGSGRILARYILSPRASVATDWADITIRGRNQQNGRRVELTFTATQISQDVSQKTEKVKMRLLIRPRNQGNAA